MDKLTKNIYEIVLAEVNNINDKIRGLNFLELLKFQLLNNLLPLINAQEFPFKETINFKTDLKEKSRNLNISINYLINSLSVSKKILENDILIMTFNESSNIDIYSDKQNFKSIILHKNTGLCLPNKTVMNSKFNKNVLILEIINKDIEEILKK